MGALLFPVYAFISLCLMGWWGFGGYKSLGTPFWVGYLLDIGIAFVLLYVVLVSATRFTRTCALAGYLSPLVIVLLILIPQFGDDSADISLHLAAVLAIAFSRVPGEALVRWVNGSAEEDQA